MQDQTVTYLFPAERRSYWRQVIEYAATIQEVRIRIGRPVLVRLAGGDYFLDEQGQFVESDIGCPPVDAAEVEQLLLHICHDSPYAFEAQLREGFLTARGGHRIGIAGEVVTDADGKICTVKHIYYLNIRFAHQLFGVAEGALPFLYQNGMFQNTLLISPPGCGKTTLLRELIRNISNGNVYGPGMQVGVVDERSEIAGSYLGVPYNDLGLRTDVLDACVKAQGMMLLLRAMAPGIIAVDELGSEGDVAALTEAARCGCKVLASVHGESLGDVQLRFPDLLGHFSRALILGKYKGQPIIRQIFRMENPVEGGNVIMQKSNTYCRNRVDSCRQWGNWTMVSESIYRSS